MIWMNQFYFICLLFRHYYSYFITPSFLSSQRRHIRYYWCYADWYTRYGMTRANAIEISRLRFHISIDAISVFYYFAMYLQRSFSRFTITLPHYHDAHIVITTMNFSPLFLLQGKDWCKYYGINSRQHSHPPVSATSAAYRLARAGEIVIKIVSHLPHASAITCKLSLLLTHSHVTKH